MRLPRPTLTYPVTREYPASFSLAAYGGAVVVIAFLIVINVALTGYETVSVFSSDFNMTQHFWYDHFLPSFARSDTTPGNLCTARLLGLGDTVTTNYSLFQYTIASIDTPNAGDSGLAYTGWTLDDCDVTALYINVVGQTLTGDYTALVTCAATAQRNASFTLRADWSQSTLLGKYTSILGVKQASLTRADARGFVLGALVATTGSDWVWGLELLQLTNFTSPETISLAAAFPHCPASGSCVSADPPPLNITGTTEISGGTSQCYQRATAGPNDTLGLAHVLSNTIQSLWAALRIDLGNPSPNNFLVNTSVIPHAIFSSFPIPVTLPGAATTLPNESYLYSMLVGDGYYAHTQNDSSFVGVPSLLPLNVPGPAVLDGVYLCQVQQLKHAGSVFVAVVAGTYSMFNTGWAVFLLLAGMWFGRRGGDEEVNGREESKGACAIDDVLLSHALLQVASQRPVRIRKSAIRPVRGQAHSR
ncbi:hypothetical protein C8F01DRAFT_1059039 [Mycena amicta]|nr:hypothetical protein C8F01DRAFT_1059039 [Mycena amicta]